LLLRKREVEAALSALRGDMSRLVERRALIDENEEISAQLTRIREAQKAENVRRTFSGLGSPLFDACREVLAPDVLAALEARAVAILAEREAKTAAKKAAKTAGGAT
jgi:hypothetical protein